MVLNNPYNLITESTESMDRKRESIPFKKSNLAWTTKYIQSDPYKQGTNLIEILQRKIYATQF